MLGVCCLASAGHAEIFICKDGSGRTLTSDRPIPECADRAQRMMDRTGVVRREMAPPLTPEQKREKLAAEQRAKAEAAIEEERKQNDRALMARYRYERDIDVARLRSVEPVRDQIKREAVTLANAEKELAAARIEAERHKGKPALPVELQKRIDEAQKNVKESRVVIDQRELEIAQVNSRFDATVVRFRELSAPNTGAAK